ncbi:MAG: glucose dehydrogenase [Phototrophicales bacterium]|nr:MAG: glucose dehydrogenase [Phototrophicales bacterium]
MRRIVLVIGLLLGLALTVERSVLAQPTNDYTLEAVVTGFQRPIEFIQAPDDTGRFFVVEQRGVIHIFQDGEVLSTPFLNIMDRVTVLNNYDERGLLGMALHPDFTENGYFYLNYTRQKDSATIIARYQVSDDDPNVADPDSEYVLLTVAQPYDNHNGGQLAFGPDGYLYIGLGDGGSAGDPLNNGQNPRTLLGSILRIDPVSREPYTIPEDNPFVDGVDGAPEVWAYGLRNPWRFSFDIETNDLYIADVGQNKYEEINFVEAGTAGGLNFGWNVYEASHPYRGDLIGGATMPVAEYDHSKGCSVTGGYVYRGETMPDLDGYYLYGDYCQGTVWWLKRNEEGRWETALLFDTDMQISAFAQDLSGEIYILDYRGGIYQIVPE